MTRLRATCHRRGGARRRLVALALAAFGTAGLAACGAGSSSTSPQAAPQESAHGAPAAGAGAAALPSSHVHGVGRDPADGALYLATHDGLFRRTDTTWQRVSPVIDLMGFAVAGPGRFYASGHPGIGVDFPQPVGLIESRDAGRSWVVRSRGGQSDFHTLTWSPKGLLGADDVLRATTDGVTWRDLALAEQPRAVAASPDGAKVLATTANGLRASADYGSTWAPVPNSPLLLLVAWADPKTVVGVTPEGAATVSTDAGLTWADAGASVGAEPAALSASRTAEGKLEILVVTSKGVERSLDSGASFGSALTG